jgi:hypothetical protein
MGWENRVVAVHLFISKKYSNLLVMLESLDTKSALLNPLHNSLDTILCLIHDV